MAFLLFKEKAFQTMEPLENFHPAKPIPQRLFPEEFEIDPLRLYRKTKNPKKGSIFILKILSKNRLP